jgi:hypothetical protein
MQNQYYNLLMSGNDEAWTGTSWTMGYDRVFEYTHDSVKQRFSIADESALAALMSLPTLFAYEKYVQAPARVGRITGLMRRQSEFGLTFALDPTIPGISPQVLSGLWDALDIGSKGEVTRTHWAVKNVDLGHVLHAAGITSDPILAPQARPPRVFISYSWDSPEHRTWVAQLATALRRDGIDIVLDQWHLGLGEDLSTFMVRGVRESDRVLVISTEQYVRRGYERQGGVGYEQMLLSSHIMRDVGTSKFIPVVRRSSAGEAFVPQDLQGRRYLDLTDGPDAENAYKDLVRELHNVPIPVPPLGPRPASF